MLIADREPGRRPPGIATVAAAAALAVTAMVAAAGCSQRHPMETGFADQGRTQLQFYAPEGATVTVKGHPTRSHPIAYYGPFDHRLEHSPEEFCAFNLSPGRYEFKYTTAEGLPGVSVYGELNVHYANRHEARVFQRRAFIPISLPSEYYRRVEAAGDEVFPYRGQAYRTAIDEYDLLRLKQGDVIEKVFLVADLKRAEKLLAGTEEKIAVCERKIEYADERFRLAYFDFRLEVADPVANFLRTDRSFIRWEEKRQKLQHELEELLDLQKRTKALLKGDHVLARRGMLVLATEEVVQSHRDVVEAADELGEVLLVMRVGGRHMQWGDPRRELAAYQP